ncbi:hypothetical protein [Pseudomonas leptonychotis]|uniref:hypothetical protein n=1 Tax=Pseudomonas leptonychotis TaxID=2448482 RepID=UPI00386BC7A9
MTTSNIDRFDEITGLIFAKLYKSFPVPTELSPVLIVGTNLRERAPDGLGTIQNENAYFFTACLEWLRSAGYLDIGDSFDDGTYISCVLTAKGLEVLKAVPESIHSGPSLGEKLVDASKSGTKELVRGVVGEALSIGARMFTNHLGLPG